MITTQRELKGRTRRRLAGQQSGCGVISLPGFEAASVVIPPRGASRCPFVRTGPNSACFGILDPQGHGEGLRASGDRFEAAFAEIVGCKITDPAEVNRLMHSVATAEGVLVASTLIYACATSLTVSCAASRPPLAIEGNGAREIEADGPILGCRYLQPRFNCRTHELRPGEWVVCFDDGVSEAHNAGEEFFDPAECFPRVLDHGLSLENNLWRLTDLVIRHWGDRERDDIALWLLRGRQAPIQAGHACSPAPTPALAAHACAAYSAREHYECVSL